VLFEALVRNRVKDLQNTLEVKEPYIYDELPVHLLAVSLVGEVSRDVRRVVNDLPEFFLVQSFILRADGRV
jgi:hypothetical protein